MLPQNRRIPRKMFSLLQNKAKVFKNKLFLLRVVNSEEKNSRFCFSVSKKVAKSAVMRNRLRRTGYRSLEKYLLQIKPGILALFTFQTVPKDNEEITNSLKSILNDSLL